MSIDELRSAVEAQAQARVRGDTATFASYMTPRAVLQLGAARLPSGQPRRSELIDITRGDETSAMADVRYLGRWSYTLRMRWQLLDGMWRATEAELLSSTLKSSWWQRLTGRASAKREALPPRRDLS